MYTTQSNIFGLCAWARITNNQFQTLFSLWFWQKKRRNLYHNVLQPMMLVLHELHFFFFFCTQKYAWNDEDIIAITNQYQCCCRHRRCRCHRFPSIISKEWYSECDGGFFSVASWCHILATKTDEWRERETYSRMSDWGLPLLRTANDFMD